MKKKILSGYKYNRDGLQALKMILKSYIRKKEAFKKEEILALHKDFDVLIPGSIEADK